MKSGLFEFPKRAKKKNVFETRVTEYQTGRSYL